MNPNKISLPNPPVYPKEIVDIWDEDKTKLPSPYDNYRHTEDVLMRWIDYVKWVQTLLSLCI